MKTPFDLSGRTYWVFGGAGYFGQEIVSALVSLGAGSVVCADLPGKAEAFVEGNPEFGGRVEAVGLDVYDIPTAQQWAQDRLASHGTPDGAVFLITPGGLTPWQEITLEEFNTYNEKGLSALFLLVRTIGTPMAERGSGSLVLFSSMYGQVAPDPSVYHAPMTPNPLPYGMHKAAINQMTRYLSVAWGPQQVRCNAIVPGPFPHPGLQKDDPGFIDRLAGKVPLGRIGTSREIAGGVAFLLSDAASYMTGQHLVIDGGWTAW